MTDLATASRSDADDESTRLIPQADAVTEALPPSGTDRPVEWAPAGPRPKRRRLGLWIGIAAGVIALGVGAASMILIAPGTTIAGIGVGGLTPGAAADRVNTVLAETRVVLGPDAVVTGEQLGASVDALALAERAHAEHPMWNVGSWFADPIPAGITFDPAAADATLRRVVPTSYTDPVDAGITFDAAAGAYVASPAENGIGVDLAALSTAFGQALAAGATSFEAAPSPVEVVPALTDEVAAETVATLNSMLASFGFYVGDERTVPVDPATAAGWLTVEPTDDGFEIIPDEAAIQAFIDTIPGLVNREAVPAQNIINSSGEVIREIASGVTGRTVDDLSGTAAAFTEQLAGGTATLQIPVTEVPFETVDVHREIIINLSEQRLYQVENGNVIDSWLISSGAGENATTPGHFRIGWKTLSQGMGNRDLTKPPYYFQPDVKHVMYFNGDEAVHGVYWHSNWGVPMSHGCVGMPEWRAAELYEWSPQGLDVIVTY